LTLLLSQIEDLGLYFKNIN